MDKHCPNKDCSYVYATRKKPLKCPLCSAYIGNVQRIARPDFLVRDRDRDFISGSLNDETRPRLFFFWVSISRRDRDFFFLSLNVETRPRLFFFWVSMSRRDRDFFFQSLNIETRPRLCFSESQYRDETETFFLLKIDHFVVIQFEIYHIHS